MEEEGTVSLWVGKAISREELERVLEVSFSDDGDFLGSEFSRAFGIDYYEDSTREAEVHDGAAKTLNDLLHGASYEEKIIPEFEKLTGSRLAGENAVVLLYNIRYEGTKGAWTTGGLELRFVGTVRYA